MVRTWLGTVMRHLGLIGIKELWGQERTWRNMGRFQQLPEGVGGGEKLFV